METKVPFYNVVNILLPGLVFIGAGMFLFYDEVKVLAAAVTSLGSAGLEVLVVVAALAVAYEVGYIFFRLGVTAIEPLLKKMFGWTDYEKFVAAKKAGAKSLGTLSREYSYALTQITLFIALAVITGIKMQWWLMGAAILFVVLFTLTAKGHIKNIRITVNKYLPTQESEANNG
ncbi:MAG: hypothetical protein LBN26_01670 [Christensenellaceae bacterium]|jgi:hypothetical protein|nr:hypothetical protein [Christensenellaceae bacterium]